LFRAESLTPEDARVPFARGTIHAQLGQLPEARTAAERTLSLDPGFSDARRLLEALRQPQP
jgi:Flp pilus assembly protein TadD